MSKKKVTAPLTYDPGKGRPQEHLAYLNWQEMEALKRLNGNNQEQGPKGLPSFPPADAIGSSSKAPSKSPSKSTGGKMGSSSSQSGGVKNSSQSNVGAQKASTSTKIGSAVSGAQKGMGAIKASAAAKTPTGGRTGFSGAGQNAADAKVKAEAARRDAVKILRESPAYKADTVKKGIGSLGFSQQFEGKPGAKVNGAIEAQKEQMYRTAPRYTQPQAQRMMNPTAIPSMERTSYERMQLAEAARQRALATAMDPSVAGRLDQANKNYKTVTAPGGMVSRVYSDPDIKGRTLGDVVTDYGKYAYDTIGGALTAAGDYIGLPDKPVMPSGQSMLSDFYEAVRVKPPTKPDAYSSLYSGMTPYTTGDLAMRNAITGTGLYDTEFNQATASQGLESAMESMKAGASAPSKQPVEKYPTATKTSLPERYSWEGVRPYDIRVTTPPASGIDLRAPAKTRGITNVDPASYETSGEKILSVEDVPEAGAAQEAQDFLPRYVSPEAQEEMRRQDKKNKIGIGVMKRTPVFGRALAAGDALLDALTGKGIAERTADLKRAYMQSSPAQQAALEAKYPNLTKFANDAGVGSQLPMSNYQSWQDRTGLGSQGSREGGGDKSGIAGITIPTQTIAPNSTESTTGTTTKVGPRPEIYYYWDLGVNIPSPTDPNYTQYQNYLRERAAAQAAMYG